MLAMRRRAMGRNVYTNAKEAEVHQAGPKLTIRTGSGGSGGLSQSRKVKAIT